MSTIRLQGDSFLRMIRQPVGPPAEQWGGCICGICGEPVASDEQGRTAFYLEEVSVSCQRHTDADGSYTYSDVGYSYRYAGPVCPGCAEAGPEGAAWRMHKQAERMRARAAEMDESAGPIARIRRNRWNVAAEPCPRLTEAEETAAVIGMIYKQAKEDWEMERYAEQRVNAELKADAAEERIQHRSPRAALSPEDAAWLQSVAGPADDDYAGPFDEIPF